MLAVLLGGLLPGCGGDAGPAAPAGPRLLASSAAGAAALAFPGLRADYSITQAPGGHVVTGPGANGAVVPADARLRFADVSVALDLDGAAGRAYRLYRAAFDRQPDLPGIAYWINLMDGGASLTTVAGWFVQSAEFSARYGDALADADFIDRLYRNVLHRAGDPGGVAYWNDVLRRGAASRAEVLGWFSDSAENRDAVRDAIRNGIAFLEDGVAYVPAADPGPARTAELGRAVVLDGSASTVAAGRPISYAWTLAARPPGSAAVLLDAAGARPSFVPDVPGNYDVRLVVSDGAASSRQAGVTVAVVWRPDDNLQPPTGNLVYLQGEGDDYLGQGRTYVYTQANAQLEVTADTVHLNVYVAGDASWWGGFALPVALGRLVPGYYEGLGSEPWSDNGGVAWSGNERSCNAASNWLAIDSAVYEGDTLVSVDLRFGQRCQDNTGFLLGRVRWAQGDPTRPPGPVNPVPAGLWRPAPGAPPASGNFVYLESAAGDLVGAGRNYTYTSGIDVQGDGAWAGVSIDDGAWWSGDFVGMSSLFRLQPGYYGGLQRHPFNNPAAGGMAWTGDGRACATLSGWFVVDSVAYTNDILTALDLRFEQYCEGSPAALDGQVHWRAPGG
jgi:hypothetical protein